MTEERHRFGKCHRNAPRPTPEAIKYERFDSRPSNLPLTMGCDWCGEWEKRIDELKDRSKR
jgi:hypothetical protein